MNSELLCVVQKFALEGCVTDIRPLGDGLINDTFKVETDCGPRYVLQRINHKVFRDVELLQRNIELATEHVRRRKEAAGETDIERRVLRLVPLRDSSATFWHDGSSYWRMTIYIEGSVTCSTVNPHYSYEAGRAFGKFQAELSDIEATLGETIPDFHNMELRTRQLAEAVERDAVSRMALPQVREMVDDIARYSDEFCKAERMYREGTLPKRICHCDTKVSNMLFDENGEVLCIIDLDTLMPSFIFSDYGDFLRTAACTAPEDEPDTLKIGFDMEIFRAFTRGYLESAISFLLPVEIENLPFAACLFPLMQAVRFLADYINGDTYYKISYPDHNLVRARAQLVLFHKAYELRSEMRDIISSITQVC